MTRGIYDENGNYQGFDYPVVEDLGPDVNVKGVNADGNVTGQLSVDVWTRAVLVEQADTPQNLGVLRSNDNWSTGEAINAFNHIAGFSGENGDEFHAFLYIPETGMTNLGVIKSGRGGYSQSFAYDINDESVVVGQSTAGGWKEHAFRWQNGVMEDLGTLGGDTSEGRGVNIFGDVVGRSTTSNDTWRTFLCQADSAMTDLQNLVVDLPNGFNLHPSPPFQVPHMRINALGQIIGTGVDLDGTLQSYLLTPLPQD